jgi:predicted DNA-binding transcriptional regulator AlpA
MEAVANRCSMNRAKSQKVAVANGGAGFGGGRDEALWRVEQTARFLSLSPSWVYKAAAVGVLPSIRIGAALRFDPEEIRRFVRGELTTKVLRRSQGVSRTK